MVNAVILLKVEHSHIKPLSERLAEFREIAEVYSVAGSYDVVAVARVAKNEDLESLITERLVKLQAEMKAEGLGALVLFAGANIRYATASYQGNWKYNINIRYAVVPAEGQPTLFETAGSDLQCAKIDLPWMAGRIRPAITWQWAEGAVPYMAGRMADSVMEVLKEHKVEKEKIGIDNLDMPAFEAFTGADHFYNALFHELTHWTGHKSRLDRDLKNRFGSRAYAAEELVAELGAAFLSAEFGFDGDVRNAGYIATWIDLLKADKRAFFTACSRASQAADFLRGLVLAESPSIAA